MTALLLPRIVQASRLAISHMNDNRGTGGSAGNFASVVFGSPTTKGNSILLFAGQNVGGASLTPCGGAVASWSALASNSTLAPTVIVWRGVVTEPMSTVQVIAGGNQFIGCIALELAGIRGSVDATYGGATYAAVNKTLSRRSVFVDFIYEGGGGSGLTLASATAGLSTRLSNWQAIAYGVVNAGTYGASWNANGGTGPKRLEVVIY